MESKQNLEAWRPWEQTAPSAWAVGFPSQGVCHRRPVSEGPPNEHFVPKPCGQEGPLRLLCLREAKGLGGERGQA